MWETGCATVATHDGGHLMPSVASVRKALKIFIETKGKSGGDPPTPFTTKPDPTWKVPAPPATARSGGGDKRVAATWRLSLCSGNSGAWRVKLARHDRSAATSASKADGSAMADALHQAQERLARLSARVEQLELERAPISGVSGAAAAAAAHKAASAPKQKAAAAKPQLEFRATVMRCDNCSLLVDNKSTWVSIGGGFVIGMAFLKGANKKNSELQTHLRACARVCW